MHDFFKPEPKPRALTCASAESPKSYVLGRGDTMAGALPPRRQTLHAHLPSLQSAEHVRECECVSVSVSVCVCVCVCV
jgi:hypothetical protein